MPVAPLIIAVVAVLAAFGTIYWIRFGKKGAKSRERSNKRVKTLSKNLSDVRAARRNTVARLAFEAFSNFPVIGISRKEYGRIHELIAVSDTRKDGKLLTVEEIYVRQLRNAAILAVISVTTGAAFNSLCVLGLLGIRFVMSIPLRNMQSLADISTANAMKQFRNFYRVYESQFSRRDNVVLLRDCVNSYIPSANPDLAKILNRFSVDLEFDQATAIDNLESRYGSLSDIRKFCQIAKGRLHDEEAAYTNMALFMQELNEKYEYELDRRLARITKVAGYAIMVLIISVTAIVVLVYMYNMLMYSTR